MTEQEARLEARRRDLTAKGGTWFDRKLRGNDWVVVKITGDKERVVAR